LPRFERSGVLSSRIFEIHPEPNWPNHEPHDTGGHVLGYLPTLFIGQLRDFRVIGVDLGSDHPAIRVSILRLHGGYGLRITPSTAR
jgi:hypothetical protein